MSKQGVHFLLVYSVQCIYSVCHTECSADGNNNDDNDHVEDGVNVDDDDNVDDDVNVDDDGDMKEV